MTVLSDLTGGDPATAASCLQHEPAAAYQARRGEYLTSHALADFRKCPQLYWRQRQGLVPDDDRPAYFLGRAAHVLILEGCERFATEYAVGGPINARTGKPFGVNTQAYADWAAAVGKPVVSEEQYALLVNLATGVRAHQLAHELLAAGLAEGVVRAEYAGRPCQARLDWYSPTHGLVDLKTCDDLDWFEADARRSQYVHQVAFYQTLLAFVSGGAVPVYLVAVEKREPFRCGVWRVGDHALAVAHQENEAALARLARCRATGVWPTDYEEVRALDSI